MMSVDRKRLDALRAAGKTPGQVSAQADPGVLSGALSAVPQGVVSGFAQVEGLVAGVAEQTYQPVLDSIESATGIKPWNPFGTLRGQADVWAQQYKPDPITTGAAGQLMFEVSRVLTQVGVGTAAASASGGALGGPLAMGALTAGASSGRATYQDMTQRGVDPDTAANAAFIDAITIGAGVAMPASIGFSGIASPAARLGIDLGRTGYLGANVAYGAGANVAMGITQRGATYDLLKSGGYDAMAEQYAPLDGAAMTAEAVLGGIFAVVGARAGMPSSAEQAAIDAAQAARDAKHAAVDTAPGIPADPDTAVAHDRAMQETINALLEGRSPDVSQTGVLDGNFVDRPRDVALVDLARDEYRMELPAHARYEPSDRLTTLPAHQRSALRYDAPELNEYAAHIEQQYGLPSGLINALKNAGERSNSNQTSPAGARGVMQFMPENLRKYGVTDPTDPVQMIDAAGRYLRDTMRQYGGNVDAVIADYNGGPRQAREVLAGRQPKSRETQDYLRRVRQWLGDGDDAPAAPRQQGDAAPVMPAAQERSARVARALDDEITLLETERADLIATMGGEAEAGQIRAIRAELTDLQGQRQALEGDARLREAAKEIQANTPRTSYKEALSIARRERNAQTTELDDRIRRLEGIVRSNREAAQAAQRLAQVDDDLTALRANREAVAAAELPAEPVQGRASAQPDAGAEDLGMARADTDTPTATDTTPDAGRQSAAPQPPRVTQQVDARPVGPQEGDGTPTTAAEDGSAPGGTPDRAGAASVADDPETTAGLALLDDQGDLVVPMEGPDGETVNVSMRQALAEADAELQYGTPDAFNAAVVCALTRGT